MKLALHTALLALAGGLALPLVAQDRVAAKVQDAFTYPPSGAVKLEGHLGEQVDLCRRQRVMAQDVEQVIAPFIARADKNEWRSEFWGKWITSAELAYYVSRDTALKDTLEKAVKGLIATQTRDGYIGAYAPSNHLQSWDVWGRKYTLLGLLGWYDLAGDATVLQAAVRHADFVLTEVGPAKPEVNMFKHDMWTGMASSSVIEPMILLYRRTGDARYLDFARWIIQEWEKPYGPDLIRKVANGVTVFKMFPGPKPEIKGYMDVGRSKSYEMMSCFEGLLELYRVTGQKDYFDAAQKVFDDILNTEITVIGSGSDWERWCDGRRRQTETWNKGMETCVSATWIKFAAQLLRLTGESRYADEIETATYNALLGAHGTDGTWWCHHAPLAGTKERAPEQCKMHQNCCVASGPRGLMLLPMLAVMNSSAGPVVNLYGQMETTVPLADGNQVRLTQKSDYPVGDRVDIKVVPNQTAEFTVRLRIPAWSQQTKVEVNGKAQTGVEPGHYFAIKRSWRSGDRITLTLDMRPRLVPAPGNPDYAAVLRGPVVLARDARLGADVDAPVRIKTTGDARLVALKTVKPPKGSHIWTAYKAPTEDGQSITLCDFASAGNTWSKESQFRVWMPYKTPVAK